MKYGEYFIEQREKKGKTQNKAAKEIGISQQVLNKWERDISIPTIDNCIKLADYYGVSLDELVGREFGHDVEHTAKAIQVNNGGNNTQNNYFKG